MLLPRKQKPDDDKQGREEVGRSESGTARFAEFSKLSAKMVDLSLREAQRDLTLRGTVPNKLSAVSSPLLWPSTDVQRIAQPPAENAGTPGTAARKAAVAAAMPLNPPQAHGTPRELRIPNFAVLYSRATVILREMTNYWNKVPRTLGSWLARLRVSGSAAVMLPARAPAVCAVMEKKFAFARPYRCRDCGREVGFRSRPRTLMERYILPLLLMKPVRCAECFRRDYRLIFTPVRERSHHGDETVGPHRNAA